MNELDRISAALRLIRYPVPPGTRRRLHKRWHELPEDLRRQNQFLGRQYVGCGATIGMMPRCDFGCSGCYLGEQANRTPADPVEAIKRQLWHLRRWLGEGGNVQLTDGEVTLRAEEDLVQIIRYARGIGLVPMMMTHGDAFRRDPGLLPRLVTRAGLSDISIHVDTTQRGRLGNVYRNARSELDLMPLRAEFAQHVRAVRRQTGRRLDVATTFTVTRDNLAEVPAVVAWTVRNADAFKMISFQPVAQVGRTRAGLGGSVDVEELWDQIAAGLGLTSEAADAGHGTMGHPGCSRFLQGVTIEQDGGDIEFRPLYGTGDPWQDAALHAFADRFGGATFRLDTRGAAAARVFGMGVKEPLFFLRTVLPAAIRWLRRVGAGKARVHYLNVVSHHFMSRDQIETPLGRERIDQCIFRVPVGSRLVSMCEVNAMGIRDGYYDALRRETVVRSEVPSDLAIPESEQDHDVEHLSARLQ